MFRIIIDAVCFQDNPNSAISVFWSHLFDAIDRDLSSGKFRSYSIIILVRGLSSSLRDHAFANLRKLPISIFDYRCALSEYDSLGELCKSLSADLFISTSYTLAFGVPNIGLIHALVSSQKNTPACRREFLLQSIYLLSIGSLICFAKSLDKMLLPDCNISKPSFYFPAPVLQNAAESRAEATIVASKSSVDFPFVLISGSSFESIMGLLHSLLGDCFFDPEPLPLGIVINCYDYGASDIPRELSDRLKFGIHLVSCKAEYMPMLFDSARLFVYHDSSPAFPLSIVYGLSHGCPVACLPSRFNSEVLSCVENKDFFEYEADSPTGLVAAIQAIINEPYRVSVETISALVERYPLTGSRDFLLCLRELSKELSPPLDHYLPSVLPFDGVNGTYQDIANLFA